MAVFTVDDLVLGLEPAVGIEGSWRGKDVRVIVHEDGGHGDGGVGRDGVGAVD